MPKMRRKTTRIYRTSKGDYVHLSKEYSLKFGRYIYYVYQWGIESPKTLCWRPSFAEARQFVREL